MRLIGLIAALLVLVSAQNVDINLQADFNVAPLLFEARFVCLRPLRNLCFFPPLHLSTRITYIFLNGFVFVTFSEYFADVSTTSYFAFLRHLIHYSDALGTTERSHASFAFDYLQHQTSTAQPLLDGQQENSASDSIQLAALQTSLSLSLNSPRVRSHTFFSFLHFFVLLFGFCLSIDLWFWIVSRFDFIMFFVCGMLFSLNLIFCLYSYFFCCRVPSDCDIPIVVRVAHQ
jgi:hypothetical protein